MDDFKHLLVAVDCFSKWVEVVPLRDKRAETVAQWLYRELIPRFGKPRWIRCDRGREFMGEFKNLCGELGVTIRLSSAAHP